MTSTSEKIAIARANIDSIEAVKNTLKTKFNIENNIPFSQYPDLIYPPADGEIVFYKAFSSYHDPEIPAYSNFTLEGMTNPSDGNGTWINQTPANTGLMRRWENGNYVCSYADGYFYFYDKGSTPYPGECYFQARVLATSEDGSYYNPKIWDNLKSADDATITNARNFSEIGYENGYVYVTLKAGVTYKFGLVVNISDDGYCYSSYYLYDPDNMYGEPLAYGDSEANETINGHACTYVMSYTPGKSGVYRLQISGEYGGNVTVQQVCYPAPEAWVAPSENPWDCTFTANYGGGTLSMTEVKIGEHKATKTWTGYRVYKKTTDDGKTYYDFADTLTENLTWSRLQPNKDEIFSSDGTLKLGYFDDGTVYPENATVWAVEIPSNNYQMWVNVGTMGGGNFIVWGDGEQTPVDSSGWNISSGNWSANARFSHTYAKAGKYTIQVIGSNVQRIRVSSNSGGSEASSNTVVKELIKLGNSLTDGRHMFNTCNGLTKIADTVQFPLGLGDTHRMFYSCSNLLYAPSSLRWQPSMNMDDTFYNCSKLTADITHWFDNLVFGGNFGKRVYQTFRGCGKIKGRASADKLWLDGSWYCNGGVVSSTPFSGCTGLSNYNEIPTPWK